MLKSCRYCGKIHKSDFDCGMKPKFKFKKKVTLNDNFRWTKEWKDKRNEIRQRDNNLCQVCIRDMYRYGAFKYNFNELSVHHCIPLEENYSKRLDDNNLITICATHHEMAESGKITRQEIQAIINEQQSKRDIPPHSML